MVIRHKQNQHDCRMFYNSGYAFDHYMPQLSHNTNIHLPGMRQTHHISVLW